MPIPTPVRLFHITAIANLPAICRAGVLEAKNRVQAAGQQYSNIAYQGAQGARAVKAVPNPPGGLVHDFVPFYFAPRSPMLMAINGGRVPGCNWRQADIVHLETTVDRVVAGGKPFVFYDCNATLAWSTAYTDMAQLDAVAWDLITEAPQLDGFCKFWQSVPGHDRYTDRMERRQAEFLVRDAVALTDVVRIGVANQAKRVEVQAILAAAGIHCAVEVKPDWYF